MKRRYMHKFSLNIYYTNVYYSRLSFLSSTHTEMILYITAITSEIAIAPTITVLTKVKGISELAAYIAAVNTFPYWNDPAITRSIKLST